MLLLHEFPFTVGVLKALWFGYRAGDFLTEREWWHRSPNKRSSASPSSLLFKLRVSFAFSET